MELHADDVTFLRRRGEEVLAWGVLLACKVHRRTFDMLPWLRSLPRRPAATVAEEIVDVAGTVGAAEPALLVPSAVFFLGERTGSDHEIRPLDKVEAMTRLTRENVRAGRRQLYGQADGAFRAIGRLVAACDVFELRVGPALGSLAGAIGAAMER